MHALVTVEVMIGMHGPRAEGGRQHDATAAGDVACLAQADKHTVHETVSPTHISHGRLCLRRVFGLSGEQVGGSIGEIGVDVSVLGTGLLFGDDLG